MELVSSTACLALDVSRKIQDTVDTYNDMCKMADWLGASVAAVVDIIERSGSDVDESALIMVRDALRAIDEKLDALRRLVSKKWMCVPYGWMILMCGPNIFWIPTSSKILKDLKSLDNDLVKSMRMLELNIMAGTARAVGALSASQAAVRDMFHGAPARAFWIAFNDTGTVTQEDLSLELFNHVRDSTGNSNDSLLSKAGLVTSYISAMIARAGVVHATDFSDSVGLLSIDEWISQQLKGIAATVILPGHFGAINCMCGTPNGIITGGNDGCVKYFSNDSGHANMDSVFTNQNDPVLCVAFDSGWVATGAADGIVKVWELTNESGCESYHATNPVVSICFLAGMIAFACDRLSTITVKRFPKGKTMSKIAGHPGGVTSVTSSKGSIISTGRDRAVRVWMPTDGKFELAYDFAQVDTTIPIFVNSVSSMLISVSRNHVSFLGTEHRFTPDNPTLIACGYSNGVVLCSVSKESPTNTYTVTVVNAESSVSWSFLLAHKPTSMAVFDEATYIGLESGEVYIYNLGGLLIGKIEGCSSISQPYLDENNNIIAAVAVDRGVLIAGPDNVCRFINSDMVCSNEMNFGVASVDILSTCMHYFVVCAGRELKLFDGELACLYHVELPGYIASVCSHGSEMFVSTSHEIKERRKSHQGDILDVHVINISDISNVIVELSIQSDRVDTTCFPICVFSNGGIEYVTWPAVNASISVLDYWRSGEKKVVAYSHMDADPVTSIAAAGDHMVTVHGMMDVIVWGCPLSGPIRKALTTTSPVVSVFVRLSISGQLILISGGADGCVTFTNLYNGECRSMLVHSYGPVRIVGHGERVYTVGVEGAVSKYDITIDPNWL